MLNMGRSYAHDDIPYIHLDVMTMSQLQTSTVECLMKYQTDDRYRPQYHTSQSALSKTSRQWVLYTDIDIIYARHYGLSTLTLLAEHLYYYCIIIRGT